MDSVTRDNDTAKQFEFLECLLDWELSVSHLNFLLQLKTTHPFLGIITQFLVEFSALLIKPAE